MSYLFDGEIESSKSLFNRSLIVQSFNSDIELVGHSKAEDVRVLKEALLNFQNKKMEFYCGSAGTALRFLTPRLGRQPGTHILRGTERLFQRPQMGLLSLMKQLGLVIEQENSSLKITGDGWKKPSAPLKDSGKDSSQFLSGVILSAWDLDYDLEIELSSDQVSQGYLDMTLNLVKNFGMKLQLDKNFLVLPKHSKPSSLEFLIEPDMSSAFVVATLGALCGKVSISEFPKISLQPDFVFVELLKSMGVQVERENLKLSVSKSDFLKPINVNLNNSPDLFPVLLILCAQADGESHLSGAPHLKHKESNRWLKGQELLRAMNVPFKVEGEILKIFGQGQSLSKTEFLWNPDQDHRWAFAAGILKKQGWKIEILHPEVVDKSFPDFWKVIGLGS